MLRVIGNDQNLPRQEHAVASGTLTDGTPVVVNSDGTVSVVAETSLSQQVGSEAVFESAAINEKMHSTFDVASGKVVIFYRDSGNSEYGTAVVGTVSGMSISFGTPVVFQSSETRHIRSGYDANAQKVVAVYRDQADGQQRGKAIVGTVSGTSISFGSTTIFSSGDVNHIDITYDSSSQKVAVVYMDGGASNRAYVKMGTISGTSISFGSQNLIDIDEATAGNRITYDANANRLVVVFQNGGTNYGTAIVGTVSGTSVSYGSIVVFQSSYVDKMEISYDSSAQKVVVAYVDYDNSQVGAAKVGTVSGTSISFGSRVVFHNATTNFIELEYDSNAQKMVAAYTDPPNSDNGTIVPLTVSGTSITVGSDTIFNAADSRGNSPAFDSTNNKIVIGFQDRGNSNYGTAVVFQNSGTAQNLTSENYIGISRSGAASGAGAIIDTQGAIADIPVINYVLSSASYDSVRFNSSSQDGRMSGIAFNTNGTKMYLVGTDNDSVYQYSLSTPFNVSTASYDSVTLNVSSQSVFPSAIEFNNDGTKMFIGSSNTNGVFQYSLSSGFDLSTASYDSVSFDPSSQESNVQGIQFNNDGTKMYIIGTANNTVFQYSLSTGFNLSTASYDSVSFSVASQNTTAQGLEFNNDGTKLFVVDNEPTEEVYQYDLTTGFDISTASYSNIKLDVSSQDSGTYGISFNADGSKMYLAGQDTDYIYQYSTAGSSLTAGQSYYVQNDGTLGTTAASPSVFAGTAVSATKLIVKG